MDASRYRYAGVAAVATLWLSVGGVALLAGFPLLGERPLSWLAEEPVWGVISRVGLGVAALLLVAFHQHVRRRFPVSRAFSVSMLVGLAGQGVAAVFPISGGPVASQVHTVAALVLGASLPVLMGCFAAAQPPGQWRRVARGLFVAEVAACIVGIYLSRISVAAPVAEILPAACFHVWIVVLTTFAGNSPSLSPGRQSRSSVGA